MDNTKARAGRLMTAAEDEMAAAVMEEAAAEAVGSLRALAAEDDRIAAARVVFNALVAAQTAGNKYAHSIGARSVSGVDADDAVLAALSDLIHEDIDLTVFVMRAYGNASASAYLLNVASDSIASAAEFGRTVDVPFFARASEISGE